MAITYFKQDELPVDAFSHEFVGEQHGGVGACVIFVEAAPGEGPRLHRHPYAEILIVIEGIATYDDGQSRRDIRAGEMAVVEAHQPHAFVNSGDSVLRQIDVHLSPKFVTEWLA